MTITIALDSDNPRKLRELAKFINELANIAEIEKLDETNERKIDVIAKPVLRDIAGNAVGIDLAMGNDNTVTLPFFPKSWKNVQHISKANLVESDNLEYPKITDPNGLFTVTSDSQSPLVLRAYTKAQIESISDVPPGTAFLSTTDNLTYVYDGSVWTALESQISSMKMSTTDRDAFANAAIEEAQQYFKTPETVEQDESASNELDASGLPWDARLHSRTRSKTTDGLWRRQRGLSPSKANKLELEIRASVTDAQKIAHEESKPIAAPPPPPFTHIQAPPPPPAAPTEDKYIALVKKITVAVETEKLSYEKVKDILMQFGIADLAALKNVPHLYAVIDQQVSEVAHA